MDDINEKDNYKIDINNTNDKDINDNDSDINNYIDDNNDNDKDKQVLFNEEKINNYNSHDQDDDDDDEEPTDVKKALLPEIVQWGVSILIALVIALLIRGFVFEIVLVSGHSMDDTLADGQRLYVNKISYYFSDPKQDDVVILVHEEGTLDQTALFQKVSILKKIIPDFKETDYVKRIIGIPGDKVDIKNGKVYVNDKELSEPYAKGKTYQKSLQFPLTIPPDKYLVLGDNRENSSDGREFGLIDRSRIKGKAVFVVLPLNNIKTIK